MTTKFAGGGNEMQSTECRAQNGKTRRRRGIWKRVDGNSVRYELDRKRGLKVRRGRRRKERVIGFSDLLDLAEGQLKMNLI